MMSSRKDNKDSRGKETGRSYGKHQALNLLLMRSVLRQLIKHPIRSPHNETKPRQPRLENTTQMRKMRGN